MWGEKRAEKRSSKRGEGREGGKKKKGGDRRGSPLYLPLHKKSEKKKSRSGKEKKKGKKKRREFEFAVFPFIPPNQGGEDLGGVASAPCLRDQKKKKKGEGEKGGKIDIGQGHYYLPALGSRRMKKREGGKNSEEEEGGRKKKGLRPRLSSFQEKIREKKRNRMRAGGGKKGRKRPFVSEHCAFFLEMRPRGGEIRKKRRGKV